MKIKKILNTFFTPRFTTSEIENSRTRSGVEHEIKLMIYDDDRKSFPTRAFGRLPKIEGTVVWDQQGKCTRMGSRLPEYDLVHPSSKEMKKAKPAFMGIAIFFVLILITIIFN